LKTLGILLYLFLSVAHAEIVHVAVASNFILPAQEIAKRYEQESGHQIKISSGSSGKFFAQIQQGAPFQVFLSADTETPEKLIKEGLAVAQSQKTYAIGKLVLWSSNPHLITDGAAILNSKRFNKLAIANPELAPYGRAAIETLKQSEQYQQLKSKIVWGENIAQAHQFVLSGNAELGFVSASQVIRNGKVIQGSAWMVPDSYHSPILQDAVLLSKAKNSLAALKFLNYLSTDQAREIIQQFGYDTAPKESQLKR
jgi:molybdate transport system substrate-binding protein